MRTEGVKFGTVGARLAVSTLLLSLVMLPSMTLASPQRSISRELGARRTAAERPSFSGLKSFDGLPRVKGPGDCNADLSIAFSPMGPTVGGIATVTLTIENVDSQDLVGMPIPQNYTQVSYWPSCVSTVPCVPDNPLKASFVNGTAVSNCVGGAVSATPMVFMGVPGGQINFDFAAPGVNIPNASSCMVTFDVMIDAGLMDMDDVRFEASSNGTCDVGVPIGVQPAGSTNTGIFAVVPTLGTVALAILGLLLAAGSWQILRRRRVSPLA